MIGEKTMRRLWVSVFLMTSLATAAFAAGSGPSIQIINNKVSNQAEAIPLSRLLRLLDRATGMTSKVPSELANRNITVRFTGLSIDEAIKKIFEAQPYDYAFIAGQGIIVTALSQTTGPETPGATAGYPPAATTPNVPEPPFNNNPNGNFSMPGRPGVGMPGAPGTAGPVNNGNNSTNNTAIRTQPAVIQTPFGPIPNPNANAAPSPLSAPGQQQPAGLNNTPGSGLGSPIPSFGGRPTSQPAPAPFGFPQSSTLPGQRNP
jgi:hypothetical protein